MAKKKSYTDKTAASPSRRPQISVRIGDEDIGPNCRAKLNDGKSMGKLIREGLKLLEESLAK